MLVTKTTDNTNSDILYKDVDGSYKIWFKGLRAVGFAKERAKDSGWQKLQGYTTGIDDGNTPFVCFYLETKTAKTWLKLFKKEGFTINPA